MSRLGISNLAWPREFDEAVADRLGSAGVESLDIAPGRYLDDPAAPAPQEAERVRRFWADRGIRIHGLQALFHGARDIALFGDDAQRQRLLAHLDAVLAFGEALGARRAVFGSPALRDPGAWPAAAVHARLVDVFRAAGDLAAARGIVLCIEPNPALYGGRVLLDHASTAEVVRACAHPAVALQFDLGALLDAGDDAAAGWDDWGALVAHAHLSEPRLPTFGDGPTPVDVHARLGAVLAGCWGDLVPTLEMLPPAHGDPVAAVGRAIDQARRFYVGAPA